MKTKLDSILYFISGALFIIVAVIQSSYIFLPIGCCFLILGISNNKGKDKK